MASCCTQAASPAQPPVHRSAHGILITGIAPTGAGTAQIDGLEVVVPGALPGDRVDFEWQPPKPGGRRGLAVGPIRLREKSTDRVSESTPRCPHAGVCGGCPLAPLRYEAELAIKTKQLLADELDRAGFSSSQCLAAIHGQPAQKRTAFRNKAVLYPTIVRDPATGALEGRFGFFRAGTHDVVPAEDCPLAPEWMHEAARLAASLIDIEKTDDPFAIYDEASGRGSVRALLMREGASIGNARGERLLTLVLKEKPNDLAIEKIRAAFHSLPLEHLSVNVHTEPGNAVLSFARDASIRIEGQPAIRTALDDLIFEVRPETFLQVNTPQTPVLYERALSLLSLEPEDGFLDLYAGIGTITLLGARRARFALGVEVVDASVACARENAARNGIDNARFLAGPVERVLASDDFRALSAKTRFTKAILDPAYKGLAPGVAEALSDLPLERIVYVACGPKNFVRDAVRFRALGFTLVRVEAIDLFPGALHIEAIGVFERHQTSNADTN